MAQPTDTSVGRRQATASELLFVMGSLEIQPDQVPAGAARQLAERLRADKLSKAPVFVAGALWTLQAAGAIALELRRGKSLGILPRTDVIVEVRQPGNWAGIEGELLATLAARSPRKVEELVSDWFGKKVNDSDAEVTRRVVRHAQAASLVEVRQEDTGRGKIGGLLRGRTKEVVAGNAPVIAAEAEAMTRLAEGWLGFNQIEQELASELVKRCRKALAGREFSDSDNSGPGFD